MIEFLKRILPEEGVYCLAIRRKKADGYYFQHKSFTDITQMAATAAQFRDVVDVFYAMGSLKQAKDSEGKTRRTLDNIDRVKAFWVDLDCGAGKAYNSQVDAVTHLKAFVDDIGLPKPTVVSSGYGIHAYWTLTQSIDAQLWTKIAVRFEAVIKHYGLRADAACTANCNRVLRVVDTFNHKNGKKAPVKLLRYGKDSAATAFVDPLKAYYKANSLSVKAPSASSSAASLFEDVLSRNDFDLKLILKNCNQMAIIHSEGGPAGYERRASYISVARRCKDHDFDIFTRDDPDPDTVEAQTEQCLNTSITQHPHTCERFETFLPGGCDGCQFKGMVKSPISIEGYVKYTTETEYKSMPAEEQDKVKVVVEDGFKLPVFPKGYYYKNGRMVVSFVDKEGEQREHSFLEGLLYVEEIFSDHKTGLMSCRCKYSHGKDKVKDFILDMATFSDMRKIATALSSYGAVAYTSDQKFLGDYMVSFMNMLKERQRSTTQVSQLGWDDKHENFLLTDKIFGKNGDQHKVILSHAMTELGNQFVKSGSLDAWRSVIDTYAMPGYEGYAFGHLCGYGSLLLDMTNGLKGAMISLQGNSGSGKSTVLRSINTIFGKPDSYITQIDTLNVKYAKMGFRNNICSTFDEISNIEPDQISNLAYSITQGRAKDAMNQDRSIKTNNATWTQFLVVTTNHSLLHKLSHFKSDATAESLRMFEFGLNTVSHKLNKIEADEIFDKLNDNYGHAGEIFVKYLVANYDKIKARLKEVQRKIDNDLKMANNERYWSAIVACNLVGGEIAKELDLHSFDMNSLYKWIVDQVNNMRSSVRENTMDHSDLLNEFIASNVGTTLIIKQGDSDQIPRDKVFLRYEEEKSLLYIDLSYFKKWVTLKGGDWGQLKLDMMKAGTVVREAAKVSMTKGTSLPSANPTSTIVLRTDGSTGLRLEPLKMAS